MLQNYFLVAFRNLVRNKEYAVINIAGLAISLSSCLLLFYMVRHELSFDTFHGNSDRIYRVVTVTDYPEGQDYGEGIPVPFPDALRNDFPELAGVGTILSIPNSQIDVRDEQKDEETKYREADGVFFAEPQFFEIFDFKWLHGSPRRSLVEPNTVVLSRTTAEKYFGDWRRAIGKTIQYRQAQLLKVAGVLEDVPGNSDFPLKVVISYSSRAETSTNWGSITSRRQCYVLLDEHTSPNKIQTGFAAFEKKYRPDEDLSNEHFVLQPLADIHFDARYGNYNGRTISRTTLFSLGMIGFFLIATAAINFVNLAIAQVIRKSKEVGIRKVLGGNRWQLSFQFFGEAFLLLVLAAGVSIVITSVVYPLLAPLLHLPADGGFSRPWETGLFLLAACLIITALSGSYPAKVVAGFKPVQALKNKISNHSVGGTSLRKSLVVVQFIIAQVLVIVTLVVVQQLDFFRKTPLGFDQQSIILFTMPTDSLNLTKADPFRNALRQLPETKHVSFSFNAPLSESNRRVSFQFNRATEDAPFEANVKYADVSFFKTYDLSLVAGRFYEESDTAREYVVNETFLKRLGITNPEEGLGKLITMNDTSLPIVGVLKDYHLHTLQEEIEPLMLVCNNREYRYAGVKLDGHAIAKAIPRIEKLYASFFPEHIFEYKFMDENVARQYADEERISALTNIFACVAIFISCLGLYGLISFMAVQRTKEVGVRKVLGASLPDILALFYKEFIVLVFIAFAVSAPLAWYFTSGWLSGFAYRIEPGLLTFIGAMAISLAIALATVSFRSVKAALANPVDSLRNE